MPPRKTRKQKKQRNQKGGAGIFSLFSKPTIVPEEEIEYESILSSLNRVYLFLYSKLNPSTPGYIPLKEGQVMLTENQKNFFQTLLQPYLLSINNNGEKIYRHEELIHDLFDEESDKALEAEIRKVEKPSKVIRDIIFNKPAKAESYAGDWYRFISLISYSEKELEYIQDNAHYMCRYDEKVDQNRPIRSLSEPRCVLVIHNKEQLNREEENVPYVKEFQMVYGNNAKIGSGYPLMQVKKEYMPIANRKPISYSRLNASKLMKTSFVLDAFINNAVLYIQPDLAQTIERENKRIWNQYSLVKVVNHRKIGQHDIYNQKFISVVDTFPVAQGTYFLLPNLPSMEKVRGMDVQSTLQMRVRYPTIWKTLGEDPNLAFFQSLKYLEQIDFAVLQFQQYTKLLSTSPETAFRTAYLSDLRIPATKEMFLRNIEADSIQVFRALLERHR